MPVKGTKTVDQGYDDVVISTYVSGAAVAPGAGELSVYADLAVTDQHRELEVYEAVKELLDHAREADYDRPDTVDRFYLYTLATHQITQSNLNTAIVEGMVAIAMDGAVRASGIDSTILDAEWRVVLEKLKDMGRLTV